jgi:hypothetical protein
MAKLKGIDHDCFAVTFECIPHSGSGIYLSAQIKQRLLSLDADVSVCTMNDGSLSSPVTISRSESEALELAVVVLRRIQNRTGEV